MTTLIINSTDLNVLTNRMLFVTCKLIFSLGMRRIVEGRICVIVHLLYNPLSNVLTTKFGNLPQTYKVLHNMDEDDIDALVEVMDHFHFEVDPLPGPDRQEEEEDDDGRIQIVGEMAVPSSLFNLAKKVVVKTCSSALDIVQLCKNGEIPATLAVNMFECFINEKFKMMLVEAEEEKDVLSHIFSVERYAGAADGPLTYSHIKFIIGRSADDWLDKWMFRRGWYVCIHKKFYREGELDLCESCHHASNRLFVEMYGDAACRNHMFEHLEIRSIDIRQHIANFQNYCAYCLNPLYITMCKYSCFQTTQHDNIHPNTGAFACFQNDHAFDDEDSCSCL